MKIRSKLDHVNINVTNLDRSIAFYSEALGLDVVERKKGGNGAFELVYLGDGEQNVRLELTWLSDHTDPYELGENESHICFRVEGDYDQIREFHRSKGWVCYENEDMGLYFINDPDDYWIEVLPMSWR
ncbi:MAG: VOC family protein [Rikenellaceae bacterium]